MINGSCLSVRKWRVGVRVGVAIKNWTTCVPLIFLRFYLFILEKVEGEEKETERNIDVKERHESVASQICPDWGLNPQPRHVP